jgi:putative phosphonate catabolism associated alcohol dehydrogenase
LDGVQMVFRAPGTPLDPVRMAVPTLGAGQVLVRNGFATLCRSDVTTWLGKRREPTPTVLGHEVMGAVVAFGPQAPAVDVRGLSLAVGDRVTWAIFACDPDDPLARAGMPQKAARRCKYGHEVLSEQSCFHGGLAEYTVLRAGTPIAHVSPAVPDEVAALINCSVSTAAGALRLAAPLRGCRLLVSGAGMLGLATCALAGELGAALVAVVDVDATRADRAAAFGAHVTRAVDGQGEGDGLRGIGMFDVVVETSGAPAAMQSTLRLLDTGGVAVWIGAVFPQPGTPVDAELVLRRLLTIRGLHNYNGDDFRTAVELVERLHVRLPFEGLVRDVFPLHEADAAFARAATGDPVRVGVRIPPAG